MLDSPLTHPSSDANRGYLSGLAVGVVTANDDPENLGRVRVRLPWQASGDTSFWARTSVPMAGHERGIYFVPEIDDEVLVGFENGDPSHPYILGGLWSQKQRPPVADDDGENNERLIRTRSGHLLRFSDDEDNPEAELALADGRHVTLNKDSIVIEDGDSNNVIKIDTSSGSIEVTAERNITLKAKTISIDADQTLNLKGGQVRINDPG